MLRRTFLAASAAALLPAAPPRRPRVETVRGPVEPSRLGVTLMHEHILVDFVGASEAGPHRYKSDEVFAAALPKLKELKAKGCQTLVECTPAYLGRDAALFRRLSEASGLHIVTNTGFYGAGNDRYVPKLAEEAPAEELARIWSEEYRSGIGGAGIKPGFMKIGVDAGPLSSIDRKLMEAACLCHRATGLRMHVHTGDGRAAADILDLLAKRSVPASAYVWVHAQNAADRKQHAEAAKAGAWIEWDGIHPRRLEDHVSAVADLIGMGHLGRLLVSQDSGWYRVGEPGGGQYNGYTYLFEAFVPALVRRGITEAQVRTLLVENPAKVLVWP